MEAHTTREAQAAPGVSRPRGVRRLATETKQAIKTTEFWSYIVVLAGLLIAGAAIDSSDTGADIFTAPRIWLYAVILTVGYMISRGLAKSGTRDPYWDAPSDDGGAGSLTERVKSAAQVLKEGEGSTSEGGGARH